jgi:hypothetical protein
MSNTHRSTWSTVHTRVPPRAVRRVALGPKRLVRSLLLVGDRLRPGSQLVVSAPCPACMRAAQRLRRNSRTRAHCRGAGQEPPAARRQRGGLWRRPRCPRAPSPPAGRARRLRRARSTGSPGAPSRAPAAPAAPSPAAAGAGPACARAPTCARTPHSQPPVERRPPTRPGPLRGRAPELGLAVARPKPSGARPGTSARPGAERLSLRLQLCLCLGLRLRVVPMRSAEAEVARSGRCCSVTQLLGANGREGHAGEAKACKSCKSWLPA